MIYDDPRGSEYRYRYEKDNKLIDVPLFFAYIGITTKILECKVADMWNVIFLEVKISSDDEENTIYYILNKNSKTVITTDNLPQNIEWIELIKNT